MTLVSMAEARAQPCATEAAAYAYYNTYAYRCIYIEVGLGMISDWP